MTFCYTQEVKLFLALFGCYIQEASDYSPTPVLFYKSFLQFKNYN